MKAFPVSSRATCILKACAALMTISALPFAGQSTKKSPASQGAPPAPSQVERIASQVYKQIVTLPQYGVFDHIHFAIKGDDTVILRGEASRPVLKSSAENVVKKIEGVKQVINEIEVLPVSPNDDRVRAQTYARIYGNQWLSRYTSNRGGPRYFSPIRANIGITNDPPVGWHAIHIIVKNGNIRLVGVVDTSGDFTMAGMQARQVTGAFAVDNDLIVAKEEREVAVAIYFPSHLSARARSLVTLVQFLAVPGVFNALSMAAKGSFERPIPLGKNV